MNSLQDFLMAGYRKIETGIESDWANDAVQKRFDDKRGICYFITVYFSIPMNGIPMRRPTAKAQFEVDAGTLNLELFNFSTVKSCEDFFRGAWFALGARYYELNEEYAQ